MRSVVAAHPVHGVIHLPHFVLHTKLEHHPMLLTQVEWHEDDGGVPDLAAKPASLVAALVVGGRLGASASGQWRAYEFILVGM